MLDTLKCTDYAQCGNTKFQLVEYENIELELVEITEKNISPRQEMFSLIFRGTRENLIPQGIYKMNHAQLGEGELFLVPIALENDGYLYEAGFNRLINAE